MCGGSLLPEASWTTGSFRRMTARSREEISSARYCFLTVPHSRFDFCCKTKSSHRGLTRYTALLAFCFCCQGISKSHHGLDSFKPRNSRSRAAAPLARTSRPGSSLRCLTASHIHDDATCSQPWFPRSGCAIPPMESTLQKSFYSPGGS